MASHPIRGRTEPMVSPWSRHLRPRRRRRLLEALRDLDDDQILFCDCADGGSCGGEHPPPELVGPAPRR